MRVALIGPSYRSQSVLADCQTCMNMYLEVIESGQGKSQAALYMRPGLNLLTSLANGQGRGIHTAQGRTFAVIGTQVWELTGPLSNLGAILRGSVVSDGQPVSMASGFTQLLIVSGGTMYCLQLTAQTINGVLVAANNFSQVLPFNAATSLGLLATPAQVAFDDGFFFALMANSNQIQQSAPLDGTTWQGVAETQISVFPDNVLRIFVDHRIMWVFGPKAIQPYFNAGDFPFILDPIEGGYIEQGLAAVNSVAKLDNSVFWLGGDERGQGMVWRANGYAPQRVSTHAIEYELSTYSRIDDAVCYGYQDQGHTFYKMNFPTASKTLVYDCATQSWHEEGYWNLATGTFSQSRAGFHTFNFGAHIVLDPTNGNIYQQSINFLSDAGNPKRWVRTAPHLSNEQTRIFFTKLQIDVEPGLGPTFSGSVAPTLITMLDAGGTVRNLGITNEGVIQASAVPNGDPNLARTLFMNDTKNTGSWQIKISAVGIIQLVAQAKVGAYPQAMTMVSTQGDQLFSLQLLNLGGGLGILTLSVLGVIGRGPQLMLEKSKDGGHTFSDISMKECGASGEYAKRVIWNRLGSGRDTVFRLSGTDPYPWRLIEGYLFTTEDPQPLSRLAVEARKRA